MKEINTARKVEEVAKFTSSMPFGSRSIDYYDSSDWPSPWEILFHGSFCLSSIGLLMFYTFVLTLEEEVPLELLLIEDMGDTYLIPVVDNQFVLNYETGSVSSYSKIIDNIKVLKRYTRNDIKIA